MSRSFWQVSINGQDMTSAFDPYLISVRISDGPGIESDTCEIELDDADAQILLPMEEDEIEIVLGWEGEGGVGVFTGKVTNVRFRESKAEGMILAITGSAADQSGKAKEPVSKDWQEDEEGQGKKFSEVVEAAGKKAGFSVKVSKDLEDIKRPYWAMTGESFLHWSRRTAREIGATVKISGKNVSFTKRNAGKSAAADDGGINPDLPTIYVRRGDNYIDCDVEPIIRRPAFSEFEVSYWDPDEAEWKTESVEAGEAGGAKSGDAKLRLRNTRATKAEAKAAAESQKAESERKKGSGSVSINGNAEAMAEGACILDGIRPGVDGEYRIDTAEQLYSKSEGWITRLTIARPGEKVGSDKRGDSEKKGAEDAGTSTPAPDPNLVDIIAD
ncbi:phage late control D family protein [Microvirga sp. Mcv34]|uniref:phage late control D family protein n=1 Tax=Microvirga sp. Mcv34 TaxID=2926016 RepID=UPI0021C9B961|nr:hypothetical protein [Microvirga sp. Mcv34]